jgi:RNA polymerase sigma-70 factor (ECF subfamily)
MTTEFEALYRRYSADLYRFSLYLCGNAADAEDIVAESFARAWTAPGAIRQETVKAYLFAIARNCFYDRARQHGRRGEVELEQDVRSERPGPEAASQSRAELAHVLRLLQGFPEVDRAALMLRAAEGMSYEEIAAALHISVGAAKVKVHRTRTKLAALIGGENETKP